MVQNDKAGRVAVLMATQNGARFLDEQLDSLHRQTHPAIDVLVSDDQSTDATVSMLEAWAKRWTKGNFAIVRGPDKGFAENFRTLLANPAIDAAYCAYCDQDDLWEADKLERAVGWMGDSARPKLFCSRTRLVAEDGRDIGLSVLFTREPSFRNALVQSIAGGNTMVFNRAAHRILSVASARSHFVSHDWWAYLMVSGAGGEVRYSDVPLVRYRQHQFNAVGANIGIAARLSRMRRLLRGEFSTWTEINIRAMEQNVDLLDDAARRIFADFCNARKGPMGQRWHNLNQSGVYRQSALGDVALRLAVITGRL